MFPSPYPVHREDTVVPLTRVFLSLSGNGVLSEDQDIMFSN